MQILITTLAEYQTVFWRDVGLELRRLGHQPHFLSFDDRSTEILNAAGLPCKSATGRPEDLDVSDERFDSVLRKYGIANINYWFGHERFSFGISDHRLLRRKLLWAIEKADETCAALVRQGSTILVQELGGFLSVIGSFFAARANGMDNLFAEPSFFRGRLFYLRNSFAAVPIPGGVREHPPQEMLDYLADTLSRGALVVPAKDRHQYTTAWKKVVNLHNSRRLVVKLIDKYLYGKRQEFGYIGRHVRTHAQMIRSSRRLRAHYVSLEACESFVYYPLHVPGDMALTLRTPHLLDQLALVDFLCRAVPHTHCVAIKEHPAMVGAIDAQRVIELLHRHDNLRLLNPSTNNYAVLRVADAVVSINSKSGAEAALLGKPVIVLGDAFYRDSPLVRRVDRLQDLPSALLACLAGGLPSSRDDIEKYFAAVWQQSVPGELYVPEPSNVKIFTGGLLKAIVHLGR
jgi:hypothetical protein